MSIDTSPSPLTAIPFTKLTAAKISVNEMYELVVFVGWLMVVLDNGGPFSIWKFKLRKTKKVEREKNRRHSTSNKYTLMGLGKFESDSKVIYD